MARKLLFQGAKVDIPAASDEVIVDIPMTEDVEFFGLRVMLENPIYGDELIIQAVLPDLTTVIQEYTKDVFLTSTTKEIRGHIEEPGEQQEIPSGIILRITYKAVDTIGRKATVLLTLKR